VSIWSLAIKNRTSLPSSIFCFRDWTSWSLVCPIRPHRTRNTSAKNCGVLESGTIPDLECCRRRENEKRALWPGYGRPSNTLINALLEMTSARLSGPGVIIRLD
jgi:hypothetical protein